MAKKWLKYPSGIEVVVKGEDSDEHRKRIMRENPGTNIEILDAPTYKGGHTGNTDVKLGAAKPKAK